MRDERPERYHETMLQMSDNPEERLEILDTAIHTFKAEYKRSKNLLHKNGFYSLNKRQFLQHMKNVEGVKGLSKRKALRSGLGADGDFRPAGLSGPGGKRREGVRSEPNRYHKKCLPPGRADKFQTRFYQSTCDFPEPGPGGIASF